MSNPFEVIELKLNSIEDLILDIKHKPSGQDSQLRYKPIAMFCDEMGMTTANIYNLARKKSSKTEKTRRQNFYRSR